MFACSSLVIARRYSEYAVGGLIGVVVTQALGYGLIFDVNFFLRNLSVMGGLLMVLSDSWVRKTQVFAGLPQLEEKDRKMYFQFAGRVLLIFLFVGFVFSGSWSIGRVIVSIVGLVACVMVVVGFKAKWSATLLVVILSVFNVLVNNFWTVGFSFWSMVPTMPRKEILTVLSAAPRAPPSQGLRQVRFLPDPVHRRRSAAPGQQRSWSAQSRREEEGILEWHQWWELALGRVSAGQRSAASQRARKSGESKDSGSTSGGWVVQGKGNQGHMTARSGQVSAVQISFKTASRVKEAISKKNFHMILA